MQEVQDLLRQNLSKLTDEIGTTNKNSLHSSEIRYSGKDF